MGNELNGIVPQSQLRQRVRGQKQFKGDVGAENFNTGLQELMNAGYIRKAPEPERDGRGRKSDGSWEVRPEFLNKPVTVPEAALEEEPSG